MYVPFHLETIHRNLLSCQDIQVQGLELFVLLDLLQQFPGDRCLGLALGDTNGVAVAMFSLLGA
jgi:hypothetical protein